MKKRSLLRANIALLIGAMACLVCYDIFGGLWLKGVTSSWFVVLGAVNLFGNRGRRISAMTSPTVMTAESTRAAMPSSFAADTTADKTTATANINFFIPKPSRKHCR